MLLALWPEIRLKSVPTPRGEAHEHSRKLSQHPRGAKAPAEAAREDSQLLCIAPDTNEKPRRTRNPGVEPRAARDLQGWSPGLPGTFLARGRLEAGIS